MIKVSFCLPRSVRVKLNSECQYKCRFCHQEGNAQAKDVNHAELLDALYILHEKLGFYRVHFTGGEPTLHGKFSNLLKKSKKAGFLNALTTNGQFRVETLDILKEAGLDSINFSLHALDPYSFLGIQNIPQNFTSGVKWAQDCIDRTLQNVMTAKEIISTKVNCVVGSDAIGPQKVLDFCIQNAIKIRFLNDLTNNIANENIRVILEKNNAKLVGHEITLLSSSHRLDYQIGSYQLGVKCIRPFYLNSLCGDCELKKNNKCLEGFYGIRLENKPLMVRLCLNKNGKPFVQNFKSFIKSRQFKELRDNTKIILQYLKCDNVIEEQRNLE